MIRIKGRGKWEGEEVPFLGKSTCVQKPCLAEPCSNPKLCSGRGRVGRELGLLLIASAHFLLQNVQNQAAVYFFTTMRDVTPLVEKLDTRTSLTFIEMKLT